MSDSPDWIEPTEWSKENEIDREEALFQEIEELKSRVNRVCDDLERFMKTAAPVIERLARQ